MERGRPSGKRGKESRGMPCWSRGLLDFKALRTTCPAARNGEGQSGKVTFHKKRYEEESPSKKRSEKNSPKRRKDSESLQNLGVSHREKKSPLTIKERGEVRAWSECRIEERI